MLIPLVLIAIVGYLAYWKYNQTWYHWSRKGVLQPMTWCGSGFDNLLGKYTLGGHVEYIYNLYPKARYVGFYQANENFLMPRDPDLIKQIAIKDFDHWTDHMNIMPEDPIWTKNLFTLTGQTWRSMRATLSPAFTASKMRAMFYLINDCAVDFVAHLKETEDDPKKSVDMKDIFTRFASDVIATCAFGVTCNSVRDRTNEFYQMGKQAINFTGTLKMIRFFLLLMIPKILKIFGITFIPTKIANYFGSIIRSSIKTREENNIVRPDMVHLMMEAQKGRLQHHDDDDVIKDKGFSVIEEAKITTTSSIKKAEITDDDIVAQAILFFSAGFDNVSTVICFTVHELAEHPELQYRLQKEIDEAFAKNNGKLNYETVMSMKYLDMVVSEGLRKWPISVQLDRVCLKPYTIKAQEEGEVDLEIPAGQNLWLPVLGLHRDPVLYPNPLKFDPERFSDENKANINQYAYLPFGVGPRSCIGSRFALMEIKTALCHLFRSFELVVTDKTVVPITITKKSFANIPLGGFWLGLKKRDVV